MEHKLFDHCQFTLSKDISLNITQESELRTLGFSISGKDSLKVEKRLPSKQDILQFLDLLQKFGKGYLADLSEGSYNHEISPIVTQPLANYDTEECFQLNSIDHSSQSQTSSHVLVSLSAMTSNLSLTEDDQSLNNDKHMKRYSLSLDSLSSNKGESKTDEQKVKPEHLKKIKKFSEQEKFIQLESQSRTCDFASKKGDKKMKHVTEDDASEAAPHVNEKTDASKLQVGDAKSDECIKQAISLNIKSKDLNIKIIFSPMCDDQRTTSSFDKELAKTNCNETFLITEDPESADHNETSSAMKEPDEAKSRSKQTTENDKRSKTEKDLKMLDDKQTLATKQNAGVETNFKSIDSDIEGDGAQNVVNERMKKINETTLHNIDLTLLGPNSYFGHHSKLVIHIHKADITKMKMEAIVNAANKSLQHAGGVARAIADAAGWRFDEDCEKYIENKYVVEVTDVFVSTGGNLPAKYVLHAVGPNWDDYENKRECLNDLRCTVLRCLVVAERLGVTSVALPSISAAIFKVPKELCAENYMEAVKHYDEYMKGKQCTLNEIHFVDVDDTMVNTVVEEFMNHWDDPCNCREKDKDFQFAEIQVRINKNDASQREDDDESTNSKEASFVKELNEITTKESADHNETFPSMKKPDEAKSRGKQTAGNDQRSKTETDLKMLDDKQTSATKQNAGVETNFKSIATGTKPLAHMNNSNTASKSQLSAFSPPFQAADKKSLLKEERADNTSFKFMETGSKMQSQYDWNAKMKGAVETRSHNADLTQLGSNSYRGHHSNIVIHIHKADITKMQMSAIVSAANRRLQHGAGVARAIAVAAGWKLDEDCKKYIEKKSVVEVTDVFVSTGGNLPAKYVLHAVGPKWDAYENKRECLNDLRCTVLRCLVVAERLGVTSVALPSISASIFNVPKEMCVENYMEAVKHFDEYMKGKKCTLKEIHFVDVDDTMINLLTEQFMDHWDKSCNCKEKDVYFAEKQVKINKNDTSQREDDAVMPESQPKTVIETQKQSLSKPVQSLVSNFSSSTRSKSAKSFGNDDVYTFGRVEIEITNKPAFDLQADNVCTIGHVFDQLSGHQNFKAEQHIQRPDYLPRNKDMFEFVFLRKPGGSSDCLVCVLLPEPESMDKISIVARNIEACVRACGKESPLSRSKYLVMTSHLLFEDAKKKNKLISKLTQVIYDYAMKCSHHNTWEVKKIFISCSKTAMPAIKNLLNSRKENAQKTMYSGGTAPGDTGSSVDPTSQFPSAYMGNQPDGCMTVTFQQPGYIEIVYDFPNGKQNNFHPNPGIWCNVTKRTAYLPLSDEGFHVLKLFRLAFLRRQTFTVDGKTNNIKWNGIFHKTELGEGKYGLQDPQYLPRVRRDLEQRGISLQQTRGCEMRDLDMFSQSLQERGYFSST